MVIWVRRKLGDGNMEILFLVFDSDCRYNSGSLEFVGVLEGVWGGKWRMFCYEIEWGLRKVKLIVWFVVFSLISVINIL